MIARALLGCYAALGLLNVAALATGTDALASATKPLLMPVLLAWLLVAVRARGNGQPALRWLAIGLVFAWLGDVLLMGSGDAFFISGIGAFLLMQVCYLLAFTRIEGPGLVRAWKIALVPYVVMWLVLNVLISDGVGDLRIPVVVYSAVLVAMAVAALDLVIRVPRKAGWRIAGGALLFVLSDALIATTAFGPLDASNATATVIMATYIASQAMIVTGMVDALRPSGTPATR